MSSYRLLQGSDLEDARTKPSIGRTSPCVHNLVVADVFQIIVKEKGVFTNVTSPSTKAKLRLLFEVAPLALLVRVYTLHPSA